MTEGFLNLFDGIFSPTYSNLFHVVRWSLATPKMRMAWNGWSAFVPQLRGTAENRCFPTKMVPSALWSYGFLQVTVSAPQKVFLSMVHQPLRSETSLDLAPPSTRQSAILLVSSPVFVKFTMGTTKRDWHHIWCHILTISPCLDMLNRSIPH